MLSLEVYEAQTLTTMNSNPRKETKARKKWLTNGIKFKEKKKHRMQKKLDAKSDFALAA